MLQRLIITYFVFLAGLFTMSLGIVLMIYADLGVPSWDVLHIGLMKTAGLTIGIWNQLVGVILITVTILLTKRFPGIGAIFNMILIGVFVDLIMFSHMLPVPSTILLKWVYMLLGILFMGFGSGMYISSRLGAGPRDGLILALHEITGRSIQFLKTIMEVLALALGWILGGPVGWGTLIFSITVGPVMQYSILLWQKIFQRLMLLRSVKKQKGVFSR